MLTLSKILKDKEDNRFATVLQQNLGKPIELKVYNSKTDKIRGAYKRGFFFFKNNCNKFTLIIDAKLTPSDTWGGLGLGGKSNKKKKFKKYSVLSDYK